MQWHAGWHACQTAVNSRCGVLVALVQDVPAEVVLLAAGQEAHHPGEAGLQEPEPLVEVVPGDLLRLGHDEDGLVVAGGQRLPGAAVLARRHREVGVRVRGPAVGLHQLVDDDVGRAPERKWQGFRMKSLLGSSFETV